MKGRSASKIKLTSYDELLGGGEETNDIQQVSLEHLHSFENHPFQVNDDEAMAELVESVKEEGILTALLVRPLGDGEYEIIAGHRRRHAAQLAGLKEVPVIIRNMDQDTAVRAMVDSNLQRPNILPSEKAFAYRMKMEAMNHQGTSGGISAKDIGKNANDSARQVYRYIRLTYLMNDLLNAVDRDVIGLQVGVELSYLTVPEQEMVEEVHESTGKYPSLEQAKKIRQAFYGIPAVLIAECKSRIDKGLMTDVLDEFDHVLGRSVDTYSDEVDETQANQMIEAAIDQYYIQQDKNGMLLFMEVMVTRMQQAGEVIVPYITENPFMSEEQISKVKAGDTISLDHDVRLKIETVKDADEKEWIGVFTSSEEMHKGSAGNVQMNQSIESILRLALNWEQVNGIVINPFGKYIQMTKKMIELLINGYEYNENERKSKDDENN